MLRLSCRRLPSLVKGVINIRTLSGISSAAEKDPIVLVDGVRTPFVVALTDFEYMEQHELLGFALRGLINKLGLDKATIDHFSAGVVFQNPITTNVARDTIMTCGDGFPDSISAHLVSMACISANMAMSTCIGMIRSGAAEVTVAGGVEILSDMPIPYDRTLRHLMLKAPRSKSDKALLELGKSAKNLSRASFMPVAAEAKEFSTGTVMGVSGDALAKAFGVSRNDQDEFALRSHQKAFEAAKGGLLSDIIPVTVEKNGAPSTVISADNGIRPSSMEIMAKLKPAFNRTAEGTITAANSSYMSDGATACLITTESKAKKLGLRPKAYIRDVTFASTNNRLELLLGPSYATPKLLAKVGLGLRDFDVFEMHEAFAGQVLANLTAMNSDEFCKKLGRKEKLGLIPMDKLNNWGGSLSMGHPFGATGVRLAMHAANRLIHGDGRLALVTACAAGGQGVAMVLERHPEGKL